MLTVANAAEAAPGAVPVPVASRTFSAGHLATALLLGAPLLGEAALRIGGPAQLTATALVYLGACLAFAWWAPVPRTWSAIGRSVVRPIPIAVALLAALVGMYLAWPDPKHWWLALFWL